MTTERDLDVQLQAARGLREEELPALSEDFLDFLHSSAGVDAATPASVLAARQLVADAHERRTVGAAGGRRRLPRRTVVRAGSALLAVAAAATVVVLVASPSADRSAVPAGGASPGHDQRAPVDPPGGLTLVAAEAITFPYSLDPTPVGLTPELAKFGGLSPFGADPVVWSATYRNDEQAGFTFVIASEDLRGRTEGSVLENYDPSDVRETGTVSVNGVPAEFVRGNYTSPQCGYGPSSPAQTHEPEELCSDSFARLAWQRPDGQWAYAWSQGDAYSSVPALTSVAESIVDKTQPVRLQVGLSPQGWSVSAYETGGLTLVSDVDPSIVNRIGISLQERWRGYNRPADVLQGMAAGNPVEDVTVQGRPAQLVSVPDPFTGPGNPGREEPRRMWYLAAELPDGVIFLLQAPDTLSRDDVLAVAEQVTYSP
jgi:hypothetical protein